MDTDFAAMVGADMGHMVENEFGSLITYAPQQGSAHEVPAVHTDQGLEESVETDGRQQVRRAHLTVKRTGDHAVAHPRVNDAWYHAGERYHVIGFAAWNSERAVLIGVHSIQSAHDRPELRRTRR